MPSFKSIFAAVAFLALANAKTVKITAKNDNRFDPDSTTAEKGDILEFHFEGSQHSVVAGDYDFPCSPLQLGSGFFSGSVAGSSGKVFRVQVNNSETIAFYSAQGNDCASGMVGIVNPSANQTLENYKGRASKLARAVSPGNATFGGELASDGSSDDSKSGQDDKKNGKDDKKNSAGMIHVSTVALASVFGAALYMF
ncbi:Cupredoxin [Cordyceps militaris CM01]|uniref:Cupredoxin n=1 Tax=Cordyceps militaris (strain CM01) TaxID=983644 RepID=G3JE31_CORMM|nr:Cupredoxin [Cordyceps militaris CM01]EGX92856.1 Cupredoxin [Cordyceps militaris CM01]